MCRTKYSALNNLIARNPVAQAVISFFYRPPMKLEIKYINPFAFSIFSKPPTMHYVLLINHTIVTVKDKVVHNGNALFGQ